MSRGPPAPSEDVASARRWLLAFLLTVLIPYLLYFCLTIGRVGPQDFDQFVVFHQLQLWNSIVSGAAKQWSPLMCGGLSLAGEPQVPFASLSMAIAYVIGPVGGIELASIAYFICGCLGAYLYATLWYEDRPRRLLAAAFFVGNPFIVWRLAVGQIDFLPFFLLPLLLWGIHVSPQLVRRGSAACRVASTSIAVLAVSALLSVAMDGAPVVLIHLLFWAALYAIVFAFARRTAAPVVIGAAALLIATLTDAGYLWPMLRAQEQFPRLTEDRFTNPIALAFHALIPLRGKILPVNGKGHELTVFLGPFIAYLLWRYRRSLIREVPVECRAPLLVVCAVSFVLGIGSLAPLGVPRWMSLFDAVRPLPGFRSIEVTGRYWGFLSVPVCLLAASAYCKYLAHRPVPQRRYLVLGLLLALQLSVEAEAFIDSWTGARVYQEIPAREVRAAASGPLTFVTRGRELQGAVITPARAVLDCYDHDDFVRARIAPGAPLVEGPRSVSAQFQGWNDVALSWLPAEADTVFTLNQPWNPDWRSDQCRLGRDVTNRLQLSCTSAETARGRAHLQFYDPVSAAGAHVSIIAWHIWVAVLAVALAAWLIARRRSVANRSDSHVAP